MALRTAHVKTKVEETIQGGGPARSVVMQVNPSGLERKRKVEEGIFQQLQPVHFNIWFETTPCWILPLVSNMMLSLSFPQFESLTSLLSSLMSVPGGSLYVNIVKVLGKETTLKFSNELVDHDSLNLISGTFTFLTSVMTTIHSSKQPRFIFIMDRHSRLRSLPQFDFLLRRIKHSHFGGATKFESVWCCGGLHFSPKYTSIRRRLYSYLDFSIRSKPILSDGLAPVSHLELLHPLALGANVSMPSDFASSGLGYRKLSLGELSNLFGLPHQYHQFVSAQSLPFLPLQILDGLLQPAILQNFGEVPMFRPVRKRIRLSDPVPLNRAAYLPTLNTYLSPSWAKVALVTQKAAKDDDAAVAYEKWNDRITSLWPTAQRLIPLLRNLVLRRHFRNVFKDFLRFLRRRHSKAFSAYLLRRRTLYARMLCSSRTGGVFVSEIKQIKEDKAFLADMNCGTRGLISYLRSSYFSWDGGSTLLFWRWHPSCQAIAREGFSPCISGILPSSSRSVKKPKASVYQKILSKVVKAIDRDYMHFEKRSNIKNLIDYFGVEKGTTDIRVVFNGTSCGLNDSLWAPNFWLPTSKSMVRILGYNYMPVDLDLGEMFLNFPLSPKLIPYSGVDLTPFKPELEVRFPEKFRSRSKDSKLFATWNRDWMGLKPSPEWACRFYYLAEEFVRGNEKDLSNPLYWKKVILNLMGNDDYNPGLPNVFKWNDLVDRIAGDIKAYVDDLRAIGWSIDHAWIIARLIASRLQYLGIQDAPRKRRVDGGPWAGTIYNTNEGKITTTVSKLKWEKGKKLINDINVILEANADSSLNYKSLEQTRGFLCHLAMTYDILFPYLKGFHLILCSHLPKRDGEGWKIQELEWLGYMETRKSEGKLTQTEYEEAINIKFGDIKPPKLVKPIPRFISCLKALSKFFSLEDPPVITQRSANLQLLAYGFVDASKTGFGASIEYGNRTKYRIGVWGSDTDDESSNFREFANLVETIEEEVETGSLQNCQLIMATDNSTVESAIFRGNSSSEKLYDLVVRFRLAELKCGSKFVVTHVSGNRMKIQGTDGISRGELKEGISIGQYMLQFCPWGKSCLERCDSLKEWLVKNLGDDVEFLTPDDWFTRAHDHCGGEIDENGYWRIKTKPGIYIWTPPPAAADAALEELRKARLKRRTSTHIILVPRLMTTLWYKQLNKAADLIFTVPNKFPFWPDSMCEPLVFALCFPFVRCQPWQIKSTPKLLYARRKLQSMFSETPMDPGDFLHQLLSLSKKLPTLPERMVRKLLYFEQDHKIPHLQSSRPRKRKRTKK